MLYSIIIPPTRLSPMLASLGTARVESVESTGTGYVVVVLGGGGCATQASARALGARNQASIRDKWHPQARQTQSHNGYNNVFYSMLYFMSICYATCIVWRAARTSTTRACKVQRTASALRARYTIYINIYKYIWYMRVFRPQIFNVTAQSRALYGGHPLCSSAFKKPGWWCWCRWRVHAKICCETLKVSFFG